MSKLSLEERKVIRGQNLEKFERELRFWKEGNPFIFRNVKFSNDVIKMTYDEFLSLLKKQKGDL